MMQPFLNMQFVEHDRERRQRHVSMTDPDGLFPDRHGPTADPVGRLFARSLAWIEDLVHGLLERKTKDTTPEPASLRSPEDRATREGWDEERTAEAA